MKSASQIIQEMNPQSIWAQLWLTYRQLNPTYWPRQKRRQERTEVIIQWTMILADVAISLQTYFSTHRAGLTLSVAALVFLVCYFFYQAYKSNRRDLGEKPAGVVAYEEALKTLDRALFRVGKNGNKVWCGLEELENPAAVKEHIGRYLIRFARQTHMAQQQKNTELAASSRSSFENLYNAAQAFGFNVVEPDWTPYFENNAEKPVGEKPAAPLQVEAMQPA